MEIKRRDAGDVTVIDLAGEIDLYNANELKSVLQEIMQQGKSRIVLNLENVPFIDSTGIGVLLTTVPVARKNGGDIKLSAVAPSVHKVFKITNLTKFFQIYKDEAASLTAFR